MNIKKTIQVETYETKPTYFFEVNELVRPEAKETMNWQWWGIGELFDKQVLPKLNPSKHFKPK